MAIGKMIEGAAFFGPIAGPILAGVAIAGIKALFEQVPEFATGTSFAPGGMALVGERGPELVNLPKGASVTPNHLMGGGMGMIPDVRIRGEDIYLVFKEAERKLGNTRG